jgi:hypothetical protein
MLAVLVGVGTVAAGTLAAAPPASAVIADDSGLPLEVLITEVSPQVLGVGQDLILRVQVRNTGSATVAQPRVLVHLDRNAFISRSSLDVWRGRGPQDALGSVVLQHDLPAALGPGQTVAADLTVLASDVALSSRPTSWGARGLAVQVVDRADSARPRLGVARTFALWFPDQEVTATRLSVLAPVVGVAVSPYDDAWVGDLEQLTRPGGRLANLLGATGEHAEVTWAVDPWLAEASGDAGPVTRAWVGELLAAMTDREVTLLPYLDPDLAALAHTGAGELLTTAIDRAEGVAGSTDLPDGARVTLAWPADAEPDLATAALADRSGQSALLVGPGRLSTPGVLTYTPSGRATVTAGGADIPVLVPDERLSAALASGAVGPLGGDATAAGPITPATAAQDLLAELAVITRERPADGRHLLITVPRDWSPDIAVVTAQLDALAVAPWVHTEPVSALVGLADPDVDRGTLAERAVTGTEVDAAALGTVRNAVERRRLIAGIVADPSALLGDLELEQLAPTSVAWRADPVGRAESVAGSHAATELLDGAVTVQPAEILTLVSSSGGLPVQVTNTLDQEVRIAVGLRPADGRLVADDVVPVTIPAGTEALVQVPVRAVQSGDVTVTVELRTADGALLDDSTQFQVRVRAEWEGIGTAVAGTLLALGLVVGVVRTIRRGRTSRRVGPPAVAGPDALSPEEQESLSPDEETV